MTRPPERARAPRPRAAALRYQPALDGAPRLVAAGQGDLARRIEAAAREAGVPVVADASLVSALAELELGTEIPEVLYEAVAVLLHHVQRLQTRPSRLPPEDPANPTH